MHVDFDWPRKNTHSFYEMKIPPFFMFVCLMVFNATVNNISVILWRPVLVVEEAGIPGENHHRFFFISLAFRTRVAQ
jgi:hypothetical protein